MATPARGTPPNIFFNITLILFCVQVSVQVGVCRVGVWVSVRVCMRVSVWVNLQVSMCE
jgi:hypothetical protein